jgi:hypothetical protein
MISEKVESRITRRAGHESVDSDRAHPYYAQWHSTTSRSQKTSVRVLKQWSSQRISKRRCFFFQVCQRKKQDNETVLCETEKERRTFLACVQHAMCINVPRGARGRPRSEKVRKHKETDLGLLLIVRVRLHARRRRGFRIFQANAHGEKGEDDCHNDCGDKGRLLEADVGEDCTDHNEDQAESGREEGGGEQGDGQEDLGGADGDTEGDVVDAQLVEEEHLRVALGGLDEESVGARVECRGELIHACHEENEADHRHGGVHADAQRNDRRHRGDFGEWILRKRGEGFVGNGISFLCAMLQTMSMSQQDVLLVPPSVLQEFENNFTHRLLRK